MSAPPTPPVSPGISRPQLRSLCHPADLRGNSCAARSESARDDIICAPVIAAWTQMTRAQNQTHLPQGDKTTLDELIPLVYGELRRLARSYMRRERSNHTLQTSALVNEAFLQLRRRSVQFQNRAHFLAIAARLMRLILVDHARTRRRAKRGAGTHKMSLDHAPILTPERAADLVALDEALIDLATIDQRKSQIVELRYFVGLSIEETAEVVGISTATVKREWNAAKAWLLRATRRSHAD
jgi:RNA polymerase sigma factor (TIGR02999 family)